MTKKSEETSSAAEFFQWRAIVGNRHFVKINDDDDLSDYAVPGGGSVSIEKLKAWAKSIGEKFEIKKVYVFRV